MPSSNQLKDEVTAGRAFAHHSIIINPDDQKQINTYKQYELDLSKLEQLKMSCESNKTLIEQQLNNAYMLLDKAREHFKASFKENNSIYLDFRKDLGRADFKPEKLKAFRLSEVVSEIKQHQLFQQTEVDSTKKQRGFVQRLMDFFSWLTGKETQISQQESILENINKGLNLVESACRIHTKLIGTTNSPGEVIQLENLKNSVTKQKEDLDRVSRNNLNTKLNTLIDSIPDDFIDLKHAATTIKKQYVQIMNQPGEDEIDKITKRGGVLDQASKTGDHAIKNIASELKELVNYAKANPLSRLEKTTSRIKPS